MAEWELYVNARYQLWSVRVQEVPMGSNPVPVRGEAARDLMVISIHRDPIDALRTAKERYARAVGVSTSAISTRTWPPRHTLVGFSVASLSAPSYALHVLPLLLDRGTRINLGWRFPNRLVNVVGATA